MFQIQKLNNIAEIGLKKFDFSQYQISNESTHPDAILVRSADMHSLEIPESVLVVGRAGAGTNNIPIQKLTERGIPVLNTPGANANAVKELVIAGMLLACRNICSAWDYARQLKGDNAQLNEQVEKNKKHYAGFELPGRTLGVIGLGNIGVEVANTAIDLGMKVIGFDPAISVKQAWKLSANVQQAENLDEILTRSDFISLHIPLNEKTHHLLNEDAFKKMRSGVIVLNFARENIIDQQALAANLDSQKVNFYVCDFPTKLLQNHPRAINLPHLGASTTEAEQNCAMMIADQVREYLELGHIRNAVNFPEIKMTYNENVHRLAIVNSNVPNMVAQISTVLSKADINIVDMINKSKNEIAYTLVDVNTPINDEIINQLQAIHGIIRCRKIGQNHR